MTWQNGSKSLFFLFFSFGLTTQGKSIEKYCITMSHIMVTHQDITGHVT